MEDGLLATVCQAALSWASFPAVSVLAFSVWCPPQGPCQPNCSWAGISPLCLVDSISWWPVFRLCGWSIPIVFALPLLLQVFGLTSPYSGLCRMQRAILDTADEICTCNLQHSWTLLEVINLQYHVIRRAAIKCNLSKEIGLSFPFFPSWRLGSPLLLPQWCQWCIVCLSPVCPCALMY